MQRGWVRNPARGRVRKQVPRPVSEVSRCTPPTTGPIGRWWHGRTRIGLTLAYLGLGGFGLPVFGLPGGTSPAGAQLPPPNATYRTFDTKHFRVTWAEGLESLADVAAEAAERAHAQLREGFLPAPAGRIDLLLVDHADFSNGFARVIPSNQITIWAHPPLDGMALSDFEDWMDLVVTHEVAHLFHLDYTGTLGRALRTVFGRAPIAWPYFSGYTLPRFAIEGVAVDIETRRTGGGRADGSTFAAMVRSRHLALGAEPLARALGPSPIWPGGQRPYVYGGLFFHHLAEVHGSQAVSEFLRAAAEQWIPYRLDAAARTAFGRSFRDLWDDWMMEIGIEADAVLAHSLAAPPGGVGPEILTPGARSALFPAPSPDGSGVAYLRADGRSDTRLMFWTPEGDRTLARWGAAEVPPRWTGDGTLVIPDVEYLDRYRVQRDLYRVTVEGEVSRLTHGLRVIHADPHRGSEKLAAVLGGEGTTRLVILSGEGRIERVLAEAEPGVFWMHPAWSPDGELLAAVRRRPEGWDALLILDGEGRVVHEVVEERSRQSAPSWAPDGTALVWGSDRDGVPNLYGVRFEGPDRVPGEVLQITALATAGNFPAVDPSGTWIYLSVLGAEGWEVGRIPYRPAEWFEPVEPMRRVETQSDPGTSGSVRAEDALARDASRPYSAFPTVLPRYWLPIRIEPGRVLGRTVLPAAWGIASSGVDLLERHRWAARVAAPPRDPGERIEWGVGYVWSGLGNPVLNLEAGQEWVATGAILPGAAGGGASMTVSTTTVASDTVFALTRERFLGAGIGFRRPRIRSVASLDLGGRWITAGRSLLGADGAPSETYSLLRPTRELLEARMTLAVSSARAHAWSMSAEAGATAAIALRQRWEVALPDTLRGRSGVDGGLREAVVTVRAYHGVRGPGFANHVMAVRLGGGLARGPGAGMDHFDVGGVHRPFRVRGYPSGVVRGRAVWNASVEWRFPLAVLDRGAATWPVYLDRLSGALFVDAGGNAGRGPGATGGGGVAGANSTTEVASVGVEFILSHALFWDGLRQVAVGLAVPVGSVRAPAAHLRFGWSF